MYGLKADFNVGLGCICINEGQAMFLAGSVVGQWLSPHSSMPCFPGATREGCAAVKGGRERLSEL